MEIDIEETVALLARTTGCEAVATRYRPGSAWEQLRWSIMIEGHGIWTDVRLTGALLRACESLDIIPVYRGVRG